MIVTASAAALPNAWVFEPRLVPAPQASLLTLACAGGAPLTLELSPHVTNVEMWPVQLPGRGKRLTELPLASLDAIVHSLFVHVLRHIHHPVALLGHSMGALVALELAREITRRRSHRLLHLFVAGCRPPHCKLDERAYHTMTTAELFAEVAALNGSLPEALAEPELASLFEPTLRADFGVCWEAIRRSGPRLPCPVTALGGSRDPEGGEGQLREWGRYTTAACMVHVVEGNHFFPLTNRTAVGDIVWSTIARQLGVPAPVPRVAAPVRRRVDLRPSVADASLDVMNFLNEVTLRYPDAISFASGRPPEDLFDVESTVQAVGDYLAEAGEGRRTWNRLGAYDRTNGIIHDFVARHLAVDENIHVAPEALVITVGAQEAMALVLLGLFEPDRDVLLTTDPAYIGITALARLLGVRVVPVPTDDDGVDPDVAAHTIRSVATTSRVRALYDIPDFNNPLGTSLSLERRQALIDVCRRHDVLLIEDNPYGMFAYDGERLPTLKALDPDGTVLYIGSFSKTLFPALRLGYLVADQRAGAGTLADELSRVKSLLTVNSSTVLQAMVGGILQRTGGTLEPLVAEKRRVLRHRRDVMLRALADAFGSDGPVRWNRPRGGYFLTLTLPFAFGPEELSACAAEYGVVVCPMRFFTLGPGRRDQIRLAFSGAADAQIRDGIARLARFVGDRLVRSAAVAAVGAAHAQQGSEA